MIRSPRWIAWRMREAARGRSSSVAGSLGAAGGGGRPAQDPAAAGPRESGERRGRSNRWYSLLPAIIPAAGDQVRGEVPAGSPRAARSPSPSPRRASPRPARGGGAPGRGARGGKGRPAGEGEARTEEGNPPPAPPPPGGPPPGAP